MPAENIDPDVEGERLRHIRALIEDILHEQDVCAQVIIAGRAGRFENFTDLRASWSCIRLIEHDGRSGVGIRSQLEDFAGDVAKQKQQLEWSVGVAAGFGQIGGLMAVDWIDAAQALAKATDAEHTPLTRADPRDKP